ncbi:MAG: hypothetical protein CVU84_00735 [Firmicutes bacterium HGW-Firmicutes-1]|nr:MAG: hypothetical protein CVU84_00735 [Firmicutes bacterium HGW-Firmicutes-1]
MGSIILYGGIILTTSILAECTVKIKNKFIKAYFALLMLIVPAFFSGVRYGIGTDYYNYVITFEQSKNNIENRIEIGYNLLNKAISLLGGNAQVGFFVVSLLTILFVYLALYEHKDKLSVGIGMFVYMLVNYQASFNNVRQLLAVAILLFSTKYVFKKKIIKFMICVLFSASIHTTALFFIPVYFMYFIVEKKTRLSLQFLLWGIIMLLVLYADLILLKLINIFPVLYMYGVYLDNAVAESQGHLMMDISNLPYILPGIFLYSFIKKHDHRFVFYYMLLVIGFIIQFASRGVFATISLRASIVFFSAFTFVIPYYIRILNSMKLVVISYLILIILIVIWLIFLFHFNNNQTVPYQWIFSI